MTPNDDLIRRAENGDPAAQSDLAMALAKDRTPTNIMTPSCACSTRPERGLVETQRPWDSLVNGRVRRSDWAQAIHWFERAASQGPTAMANLGILTALGETGHRDPFIAPMAIPGVPRQGSVEKPFYRQFRALVSDAELDEAIKAFSHPTGASRSSPPAPGHFEDAFEEYQASKSARQRGEPTCDSSPWEDRERQVAELYFGSSEKSNFRFMFSDMFGEQVTVGDYFFCTGLFRGLWLTTISWSFADFVCGDGLPVAWQPNETAVNAMTAMIGLLGGLQSVEWSIFTPEYSTDASASEADGEVGP